MNILTLIAIVIFVAVVKLADLFKWTPVTSAIVAVAIPHSFSILMKYIYLSGSNLPLWQIFTLQDIAIIVVQVIIAFFVFYKLIQVEDSLGTWFAVAVLGASIVIVLVPMVVKFVVPS